ncbi:hypothetical protein ACNIRN_25460, partial [Escherichia coli]
RPLLSRSPALRPLATPHPPAATGGPRRLARDQTENQKKKPQNQHPKGGGGGLRGVCGLEKTTKKNTQKNKTPKKKTNPDKKKKTQYKYKIKKKQ